MMFVPDDGWEEQEDQGTDDNENMGLVDEIENSDSEDTPAHPSEYKD